jgi:hypothetical protein
MLAHNVFCRGQNLPGAEMQYKLAVESNPRSSEALGSYASFLHGVKGQADAAEELYEVRRKCTLYLFDNC